MTDPTNVSVADLVAVLADDPEAPVVDVRTAAEFAGGRVPGSVNIPMHVLPLRVSELPTGRRIYLVCEVGGRSAQATAHLARAGFVVSNVLGGMQAWIAAGNPVER